MSEQNGLGGLRELGESAVTTVLDRVGRGVSKVQERRPLAYDLLESDDAYLVVFDTPGVTNADLQVQFRENAVEVRVDRFRDFFEGFEMIFPGRGLSLDGRAELPGTADPELAEATLTERGTLEVRIPKADDAVTVTDEDDQPTDPIEVDPDDSPDATTDESDGSDATTDEHGDGPDEHDDVSDPHEHGNADESHEHGNADESHEHGNADESHEHGDSGSHEHGNADEPHGQDEVDESDEHEEAGDSDEESEDADATDDRPAE